MALGAAGAALARGFAELLLGVVVIGLGFGAMDFSLNSLLVRSPEAGRAHRLSVANGGYGIGSIVGPLLVVLAPPSALPPGIRRRRRRRDPAHHEHRRGGARREWREQSARARQPRRRAALSVFVAAYILYVATESAAASWIAPQLHRVGYSQSTGAVTTAGFWLGLALGRFLAGPAHRRVSDRRLVLVGLAVTAALSLAASVDTVALAAYPVAGLSLALVYPMGLIWFTNLNPGDGDGLGLLILTMMAGGVIGPALTGVAVSVAGVRAVPVCIAVFAAADLAVFLTARQFRAPPESEAATRRAVSLAGTLRRRLEQTGARLPPSPGGAKLSDRLGTARRHLGWRGSAPGRRAPDGDRGPLPRGPISCSRRQPSTLRPIRPRVRRAA